jgi:hypothetical protein
MSLMDTLKASVLLEALREIEELAGDGIGLASGKSFNDPLSDIERIWMIAREAIRKAEGKS